MQIIGCPPNQRNSIQKNKLTIKDWETQRGVLMQGAEIHDAWLKYASGYSHPSAFFRKSSQYEACVSGKINLYTVFTEQCYNLLRSSGQCGIVVPSGVYTDLGTKQLREMLFDTTRITGLFCFENAKAIFEGVHRSYKFIALTYEKGGNTDTFPAAFMRRDVAELDRFPREGALNLSVELIRRLSPDSLSIIEFTGEMDVQIADKIAASPPLGQQIDGTWNVVLTQDFNMTTDSYLFRAEGGAGRLPLYEGKMIHQFTNQWGEPRYWVDEREGRKALLGKTADAGQVMSYELHRVSFRTIARNTDERSLIATILPRKGMSGNSLSITKSHLEPRNLMCLAALLNSFTVDSALRQRVSANINMFYVYQLPIPRLTERDAAFKPIVERAARLICTTPEFDDLARVVGLRGHEDGVTDLAERARLRAELDGMVAHLYGLTEEEFAHILRTFPLVPQATRDAALAAYRALVPQPGDPAIASLIAQGESKTLEFKERVCWDETGAKRGEKVIVKGVAALLNTDGGALLIGVRDDFSIAGLAPDYAAMSEKMGKDRDGYERFLTQLLLAAYGNDAIALIDVTFHVMDGKEVCRIAVKPSPKPVWANEQTRESTEMELRSAIEDWMRFRMANHRPIPAIDEVAVEVTVAQ